MAATTRQLSTAAERREALIEAAVETFAARGFHGTPTTEVAKAAGISQAYLFRLFPTKEELYIAAVERCYERLRATMRRGAQAAREQGIDPLEGMGLAYVELMQDRTTLRGTLHAFAAASGDDAAIRDAVRAGYSAMFELVAQLSGADDERLRDFFAHGMLITVAAGMDAAAIDEPWTRCLLGGDIKDCVAPAASAPPTADAAPAADPAPAGGDAGA